MYKKIVKRYENCFFKFGDSHLGVDWPNLKDCEKRYQIMLDIIKEKKSSVLDFGCGCANLLDFINKQKKYDIKYQGLDLSKKFIEYCKKKYPKINFYNIDILKSKFEKKFDYIIMNGVFTVKDSLPHTHMWDYTKKVLKVIFKQTKVGMAVNFMSKKVDWERNDLFHLSLDKLTNFVCDDLSRHYIIRNDYGLYEYTIYIYKKKFNI